jgi:uncharacterized membrane protein YuzA (DUF378 family)
MMHSGYKVVGFFVWLLSSIGALNWGLDAAGYNLFHMAFIRDTALAQAVPAIQYIIGFAGLFSLLMLVDSVVKGKHCCD